MPNVNAYLCHRVLSALTDLINLIIQCILKSNPVVPKFIINIDDDQSVIWIFAAQSFLIVITNAENGCYGTLGEYTVHAPNI